MSTAAASTAVGTSRGSKTSQSPPILSDPSSSRSKTYVARKPLTINGKKYKPGDVVPEANEVLRIEGWIRAGLVNEE